MYINDIVQDLNCSIRLFADDTSLSIVVEDPYEAAALLNLDTEKIHLWSSKWLVNFNARKTEAMTISKRIIKPHHPPIYMNESLIEEVEVHKHLGLHIHENGNWHFHINYMIDKVTPRLNIFRSLKFKLSRKYLQTIYFSFIRPLLEYADIVWDNIPDYLTECLENIQLESARIVTGATKLCSKQKLYEDTGWEPLAHRREKHKIIKFHDMFHNKCPSYLNDIVPLQVREIHNYNTRRAADIQTIPCRTAFYQKSFLPSTISLWNNIPLNIRSNPSKLVLKSHLWQNSTNVPKYFLYGKRKAQVLHARLRLANSNLNEHLFVRNITDNKFCTCGSVESTKHFFIDCPNYSALRSRTISTLPFPYNIRKLLFGDPTLSDNKNIIMCNCVHEFIIESKRF